MKDGFLEYMRQYNEHIFKDGAEHPEPFIFKHPETSSGGNRFSLHEFVPELTEIIKKTSPKSFVLTRTVIDDQYSVKHVQFQCITPWEPSGTYIHMFLKTVFNSYIVLEWEVITAHGCFDEKYNPDLIPNTELPNSLISLEKLFLNAVINLPVYRLPYATGVIKVKE